MIKQLFEDSPLFGANAPFIEGLYEDYLQNPESVPSEWHNYFDRLRAAARPALGQDFQDVPHGPVIESFFRLANEGLRRTTFDTLQEPVPDKDELASERKQISELQLINAYRFLGVRHANLDPLKHQEKP